MSFSFKQEKKNGKLLLLDVEVSLEKGKFIITVYGKPSFRGVHILFKHFLLTVYKFGMVSSLAYFCFKICSDWSKFYEELSFLKQDFFKQTNKAKEISERFMEILNTSNCF